MTRNVVTLAATGQLRAFVSDRFVDGSLVRIANHWYCREHTHIGAEVFIQIHRLTSYY